MYFVCIVYSCVDHEYYNELEELKLTSRPYHSDIMVEAILLYLCFALLMINSVIHSNYCDEIVMKCCTVATIYATSNNLRIDKINCVLLKCFRLFKR